MKICDFENCMNQVKWSKYCNSHHQVVNRAARRKYAKDYLGGKCVSCGSVDDLEFDHKDHTNVGFRIAVGLRYSLEKLNKELDKCQLLCHNWHAAKTLLDLNRNPQVHGTISMYSNARCRCLLCRNAWAAYVRGKREEARFARLPA